ncbi:uncharacterized protein kmr isoform X2 [Drosophila kikkawai]|uniref:Uncharacterized protein kmr isoform X2 n=1 Tax=Drosophila kikkawai TaxID=30033 RepID=A0ABM4GIC1_DROKI
MFGCIYQLWDWLEAPPLFTAGTMDAKKLQQLQEAAILAQQQKKLPLAYQTNLVDYRTAAYSQALYQQSPTATSSSGGGALSPIELQPQSKHHGLMKHGHGGGGTSSSSHSSPYHQSYSSSGGGTAAGQDQLYQSPTERTYLAAAGRLQASNATAGHHPISALQAQYQQLQAAKMQAQIATQNEAAQAQQRTFAMRQAMNPPTNHYHISQSPSMVSTLTQQQQQQQQAQQQQRAPPSSLNLQNQYQPAQGPLKLQQQQQQQPVMPKHYQEQLYAQQQQLQQQQQQLLQQQQQHRHKTDLQTPGSEHGTVYIQQNHPGHVVNQACQTQISTVKPKATPSSEESSTNSAKSPSHAPLDRKKSAGSIQALKSPITKRPPSTPVTLSGWLHKQGSDGLKVWRKRWFVLAEYCLYYYKGPEEEKLLGSVLLPSYRVSACLPEDKIYRKFAFKCEHQNMRTYWLAADNSEAMMQWVRALAAASLMQAPSSGESEPSVNSSLNHSGENSDSGIHTLQSQPSKGQPTPSSDNAGGGGNAGNGGGGAQPLYANAPPKPRRINDGGYSSPSPEHHEQQQQQHSGRRLMSPTQQLYQQQQQNQRSQQQQQQPQQHHAIYDTRTGHVSTALQLQQAQQQYSLDHLEAQFQQQQLDMEAQIARLQQQRAAEEIYGEREMYMAKLMQQRQGAGGVYPTQQQLLQAERRTPDAYGRSKQQRLFAAAAAAADYEDIYNMSQLAGGGAGGAMSAQEALLQEAASYRRPLSPPSYDGSKHVPAMPQRYTPNHMEASAADQLINTMDLRARSVAAIVRPHSADFLEYEARAEAAAAAAAAAVAQSQQESGRAPRPKSSLDINRTPDSFYYSEASYADKMRKSALYLQSGGAGAAQPQQAGSYRTAVGDFNSGVNTIGYENPYERAYKRQELLAEAQAQGGVASSMPRMSRSASQGRSVTSQLQSPQQEDLPPLNVHPGSIFPPSMSTQEIISKNEQFLRSASARLPKRSGGMDDDYSAGNSTTTSPTGASNSPQHNQDGERKREESMKRLLEWKQRMLQSPLTRKGIQQGGSNMSAMSKLGSNPNILLASTAVASGARYGPQAGKTGLVGNGNGNGNGNASGAGNPPSAGGIQRSRSESQANVGPGGVVYNSYSSDDEASISVRNVNNLPMGNLTVKPDPSDALHQESAFAPYYGGATETKYAKNTVLTDRGLYAGNGVQLATSTPQHQQQQFRMRRTGSRAEIDMLERETSSQIRNLDVSAGDLLSRTHEELVLLLIQLRRQSSQTARAIEQCCSDIHDVQNRLRSAEGLTRAESIQRLDYLKQHLLDLERHYEKSKPLVNLVDNMVKLGSLYRNDANGRVQPVTIERLEFNQRMQERHMLQEEQQQWERLSPNQAELQAKVRELYQLDQLLQEESGTLQSLQRDKEDLERALGGLRARIHDSNATPMALEAAKKQQHILERELSRVHQLLAENSKVSKKLEQTVAGNAHLEQELLLLRQKVQASRGDAANGMGSDAAHINGDQTAAVLQSELERVQSLVGDMQRQRHELSSAVRQLTENSTRLYQEIGNKEMNGGGSTNGSLKKRSNSTSWTETDLDANMMRSGSRQQLNDSSLNLSTPLYVDTNNGSTKLSDYNRYNGGGSSDALEMSGVDSDGFLDSNPFATALEKQEIKTVRIVKRESERRHRDRSERGLSSSTQNLDQVLEEEQYAQQQQLQQQREQQQLYAQSLEEQMSNGHHSRSKSLPRNYSEPPKPRHSRHMNGKQNGHHYNGGFDYDRNSNYEHQPPPPPAPQSNGHHHSQREQREHLNPLANAYFAKQLQQQANPSRDSARVALRTKTDSLQSLNKSLTDISPEPVFQSVAARQIINEMSAGSASEDTERVVEKVPPPHKHRRAVPREKRRHYTAPNNVNQKAMEKVQAENDMNRNNTNWRARDDLDMEVALRPRMNAPDVIRSALGQGEKISENTIDNLLLAPNKIVIPERYIPETTPELSPEEKKRRQEKVESIKKMLSEAPLSSNENESLPPSKINAEKKQREHLLQLNQILAQQVMQVSKIVAEKAMSKSAERANQDDEHRSESPSDPLPIFQQRDNFYS